MIPQQIHVATITVPTVSLFIAVGVAVFAFTLWLKGKREGFDEDKLFDLAFLAALAFVLGIKFDLLYATGASILMVFVLSYFWRWSSFRIADLFTLSLCASVIIPFIGLGLVNKDFKYIVAAVIAILSYFVFSKARKVLKSGYVFSSMAIICAVAGYIGQKTPKYLIFYGYLFIIAIVNIYLRERKSMASTIFAVEFINKLKNQLLSKRKRLKTEQKILMQEDAYMQEGRDIDNAEMLDEVMLEDEPKRQQDERKNALTQMQIQVRKALARMRLGKYGYCEVCGKPIDKARLEAYPEATTCLEHAPNA